MAIPERVAILHRVRDAGYPGAPVFGLVVVLLMFEVHHVQLLLGLLELIAQSSDLLLAGAGLLLKFGLQHREFFHSLLNAVLILAQHHLGRSVLGLQTLVDVL